jgi:predicted glycogen debranching enzyme
MPITFGKPQAATLKELEHHCYLLGNGLGGYSSMSLAGSVTRGDHALMMASIDVPTNRQLLVRRMQEQLSVGGHNSWLQSQSCVNPFDKEDGFAAFHGFSQELLPTFFYRFRGVSVQKELCMVHQKNQLVVRYTITNPLQEAISLTLCPHYAFVPKTQTLPP